MGRNCSSIQISSLTSASELLRCLCSVIVSFCHSESCFAGELIIPSQFALFFYQACDKFTPYILITHEIKCLRYENWNYPKMLPNDPLTQGCLFWKGTDIYSTRPFFGHVIAQLYSITRHMLTRTRTMIKWAMSYLNYNTNNYFGNWQNLLNTDRKIIGGSFMESLNQ